MSTLLGRNKYAPYCAFGDDSAYQEILLYSFIFCQRPRLAALERDIAKLKNEFGIPESVPIHVKEILSKRYREKVGIQNLEKTKQALFFRKVINIVNNNKCIVRFCYTVIPESGSILPLEMNDDELSLIENHKAIMHQMAGSCFLPYVENNELLFTAKDFEVFISHDSTRVKIAEKSNEQQAHYLSELFVPLSHPVEQGKIEKLRPNIQMMKDNIYLQLSDAVAYILAHGLSKKCSNVGYKYQVGRIKSLIKGTFVTESNQHELGVTLPER